LLRGRRGTEWAAVTHAIGEPFCLIDAAAVRPIEIPASAMGAMLTATARGVSDTAPLPNAQRPVSGEALRLPSPCHLKLLREGIAAHFQWTRRSHRGWIWAEGIGDTDDTFTELYRLTITGPSGEVLVECATTTASLAFGELPAEPGQAITASVVAVGPMGVSRAETKTFIV
jgi:hypothetical protein